MLNRYIVTSVPFVSSVSPSFSSVFWPVFAAILAAIAIIALIASKKLTLWQVLAFIIAGIFIYAGAIKALDPVQFASDIDNYKILPWPISVALAFYLPWLEIFCGFALVVRSLYRGALSILTALILVFTLATIAAKVRGLDITCGCFGHASQNWSFPAHLATNLAILAGLLALWFQSKIRDGNICAGEPRVAEKFS
jgi:putative oxidoreductase